jgi:prepilin-type processing-associated H-X9-DG protein
MQMRRFVILLLIACSSVGLAQTPESTVQKFADAISKRDIEGAAKFVVGGKPAAELVAAARSAKDWPTLNLSNFSTKLQGDEATVTYDLSAAGFSGIDDHNENVTLVHSGADWLIKAPTTEPQNNRTIIPMLAYMFTHPQGLAKAKAAAKSTACLSNVKQVALGCIMYASDTDDVLKFGASNWTDKIYPYMKNKAILTCPEDAKGVVSYSINPKIVGKNLAKIKRPADTVMLYEGKGGKLNFRHSGRAAVAFCDGHAKLINAQQAKSLIWNP